MATIRTQDKELVNILKDQLNDYIDTAIPNQKLESAVETLIYQIRRNSRRQEDMIYIDDETQWNKKDSVMIHKNKEIILTNKERELLALLFNNMNHAIAYNTICVALWGENLDSLKQERIKTLVKQIRKKLPTNIIKNIFAFGYKIEL